MIMRRNIIMLEDCTVGYLFRPAISAGAGQNGVFPVCGLMETFAEKES